MNKPTAVDPALAGQAALLRLFAEWDVVTKKQTRQAGVLNPDRNVQMLRGHGFEITEELPSQNTSSIACRQSGYRMAIRSRGRARKIIEDIKSTSGGTT